jgi:hypothetical protein
MTTWTDLSAGAVGVGGIPSGSTVTALRDNPLAIAEGSSGAPRIVGASIHATTAADTFVLYRAGINTSLPITKVTGSEGSGTISGNAIGSEFTALVACVIRVKFTVTITGNSGTSTVYIRKESTDLTSYTTDGNKSYDVTLAAGETVGLWAESVVSSTGSRTVTITNYRITANISSAVRG